jgi:hypothetical protein
VEKVPAVASARVLRASEPATASMGTMMAKRPNSMTIPSAVVCQGLAAAQPPRAEPLLAVAEE